MKAISKPVKIGDAVFDVISYQFTDEEKSDLKEALKKWKPDHLDVDVPENVREEILENFILQVEAYCDLHQDWLKNAPKRTSHREDMEELFELFNLTVKKLEAIKDNRVFAPRLFEVGDILEGKFLTSSIVARRLNELARAAIDPMSEILEVLFAIMKEQDKQQVKTGRPTVDHNSGLLYRIAKLYRNYLFSIPKAYENGPFALLVEKILEILELPAKNPRRQIRASVKPYQS